MTTSANNYSCGIDFGTTNSATCLVNGNTTTMVPLDAQGQVTTPSAIFFDLNNGDLIYGREALKRYHTREGGRLMRSLKSLLGTSTIEDTCRLTLANGENRIYKYTEILGLFIKHLKDHAEAESQTPLENVVVGRPVHFVDYNTEADAKAQNQLEAVFKEQGFKNVSFQYEPIAAALTHEQTLKAEKVVLIVDMGGGTSDFSLVRLSPEHFGKADRSADILGNHGVHIAGNDFDQDLSLKHVMPLLGYGADEKMPIPNHYFFRLSNWPEIQSLYNRRTLLDLEKMRRFLDDDIPLDRLKDVIEYEDGHMIASRVEAAKIGLTEHLDQTIDLSLIEEGLHAQMSRIQLEAALAEKLDRIEAGIRETIQQAGIDENQVENMFLTGGSAMLPVVQRRLKALFPQAELNFGDMFSSVSQGLGLEAQKRYQ